MSVFNKYSQYYDLLYKDKDYQAEVDYIHELIQRNNPGAETVLDLGCGTGLHAFLLSKKGYKVVGVDFSEEMIRLANEKIYTDYSSTKDALEFITGDVRNIQIDKKFDVVLSLFHVFSYLNLNNDIIAGLNVVKNHLSIGGTFIFDFWYGPGVLTDLPAVRVKRFEDSNLSIVRIAEPVLHPNENIVDVNYSLTIKDKQQDIIYELTEKHPMRYLFKPEIDLFLEGRGFSITGFYEWRSFETPSQSSWTACVLLQL